ncbi:MAG: hypothetical protein V9H25_16515 [Candidatus Competibacter sp.]
MAGCSTGEEAYSLAILARETMEQLGVSQRREDFRHRYRPRRHSLRRQRLLSREHRRRRFAPLARPNTFTRKTTISRSPAAFGKWWCSPSTT